jgi:hypothetical protein
MQALVEPAELQERMIGLRTGDDLHHRALALRDDALKVGFNRSI